jgi:hypothetical protein
MDATSTTTSFQTLKTKTTISSANKSVFTKACSSCDDNISEVSRGSIDSQSTQASLSSETEEGRASYLSSSPSQPSEKVRAEINAQLSAKVSQDYGASI